MMMLMNLARRLFPICRSVTGNGNRETLAIIREYLPDLVIHEVPSGTPVLDWHVPLEWNIRNAALIGPSGRYIANFQTNNLHVLGYSEPVDREISLAELQDHLYSIPEQPTTIPYRTSYYDRNWGFCISQQERDALKDVTYRVYIDSTLESGSLTYGEFIVPGESEKEILISTYICHPSMARDQVSGMVVATYLADWVQSQPRKYTYRFIFIPETIGSITYISRNLETLKKNVIAAFNICFVGDDGAYTILKSRAGDTIADRVGDHVLRHIDPDYRTRTFLRDRGSDERQFCAPGIDLPMVLIMRTWADDYPEYHTSLDNLDLISESGLEGGLEANRRCLEVLEKNKIYEVTQLCQPQMCRRGLYPTIGTNTLPEAYKNYMNILAYCDGKHSLLDIAEMLDKPAWELATYFDELECNKLIRPADEAKFSDAYDAMAGRGNPEWRHCPYP